MSHITHCARSDLKLPVYDIYVADVDDQGGRKWIVTFDDHYHPNGTDTNNTARSSLAVSCEECRIVAVRVTGGLSYGGGEGGAYNPHDLPTFPPP